MTILYSLAQELEINVAQPKKDSHYDVNNNDYEFYNLNDSFFCQFGVA